MRPGDGTYVRPLDFYAALRPLILYSIACDRRSFDRYYRVRAELEVGFWEEAAGALRREDHEEFDRILQRANHKLKGSPVEIPHREHRELHLLIFSRLENPFVRGLLEAYWDAYEAVGLHRYFDLGYYERMWSSHRAMVEAIVSGQFQEGKEVLRRHFTLLEDRLGDGGSG
jgi:DNA-binding FadR family transcriptional regulator